MDVAATAPLHVGGLERLSRPSNWTSNSVL